MMLVFRLRSGHHEVHDRELPGDSSDLMVTYWSRYGRPAEWRKKRAPNGRLTPVPRHATLTPPPNTEGH